MELSYIIWNPTKALFALGPLKVRWYSLMIILAFLGGRYILNYFYKKEGRPVEDTEELSFYILLSCMIGARLGEVLFYSPMYYLKHPLEAILPFNFTPHFEVVGYRGLSYHGALVGALIGVLLYTNYQIKLSLYPPAFKVIKYKRLGQNFLWLVSPVALGITMGLFIRIGNFVNSEILGTPTHSNYGVFFAKPIFLGTKRLSKIVKSLEILKDSTAQPEAQHGYQPIILQYTFANTGIREVDAHNFVTLTLSVYLQFKLNAPQRNTIQDHFYVPDPASLDYVISKNEKGQYVASVKAFAIPRHPVQLYESFSYLLSLLLILWWWNPRAGKLPDGLVCGVTMIACYSFRFFFEFFKDPFNILIEGTYPITMGHLLSLMTVLGGFLFIIIAYHNGNKKIVD